MKSHHASHAMYSRGCRCHPCVEFRRSYDRKRYRKLHPNTIESALRDLVGYSQALKSPHTAEYIGENDDFYGALARAEAVLLLFDAEGT